MDGPLGLDVHSEFQILKVIYFCFADSFKSKKTRLATKKLAPIQLLIRQKKKSRFYT